MLPLAFRTYLQQDWLFLGYYELFNLNKSLQESCKRLENRLTNINRKLGQAKEKNIKKL